MEPALLGRKWSSQPSNRARGNGQRLMYRKFHLNARKSFFPVLVTEHWNMLPREVVESLALQIFNNCLDAVLRDVFWDDPA
ncbi:hypothetical protein DUI87_12791 [Hirundo rustica rustica]|uniref:Uncharacterized protein n=1 Tax=Hirundo rustica rustica TaxID=333673 RepID=A0A3M0KFZ2_HIRRU|nr:hypothetical protein DUI87_12791 [Hirundo rustica rustica]